MVRTFKARVSNGALKPLDGTKLPEGDEVVVTVSTIPKPSPDWLDRIAGAWVGLVDMDKLERDIYASHLLNLADC